MDPLFDRDSRRHEAALWSATSSHGMVATGHYLATRVGAGVLGSGGNAIDAAVAASLALGVVEPGGSGIGGMAMMMIRLASGRVFALPGPCRAPRRATPELVRRSHRKRGYAAVAVPAFLSVLARALQAYGTKSAAEVLAPSVELAHRGVPITGLQSQLLQTYAKALARENGSDFFLESGRPRAKGALLRQPVLAATLERLQQHGFDDFHHGGIARDIDADMRDAGGFVRSDDLAALPTPQEVEPLRATVGAFDIATLPPPGGGTTLLEMLALQERLRADPESIDGTVLLARIIQKARQDRRAHYQLLRAGHAPPDRLSAAHVYSSAADIRGETAHLNVMDRHGNVVALTQSLERTYGAKVVTPSLGFCWNNYLQAFKVRATQHPHFLRPGAIARSNAAPTLLLRQGVPVIAIGSTGSERMASGIFQVLVRLEKQSAFDAVHAPRLHATPDGMVLLEQDRYPVGTVDALRRQGFGITALEPYDFKVGGLQLIVRRADGFEGVAEPRRDGSASGPIG